MTGPRPPAPRGVVFHVISGESANVVLRNVLNLRDELGTGVPVEVVAQAAGIGLVLDSERTAHPELSDLVEAGVVLSACRNTLRSRGLGEDDLASGVMVVPSGVARVARLQWDGYAYIRP